MKLTSSKRDYTTMSTSKLYQLAEQNLGENIREIRDIIAQLEGIKNYFAQRSFDSKPKLRVIWSDNY